MRLEGALLDEGGCLVDEDFADVFGVVDEDDGRAEEAVVGDGAEELVEVFEEADGFAELDPGFEGVEERSGSASWGERSAAGASRVGGGML